MRLRVRGLVQGVNFRYHAREEARRLGLAGWVRNRDDGDVEALAEGDDAGVDAFAAWCAHGPSHARVEAVIREAEEPIGARAHRDFRIVP